jgi:hypothetical protein
MVTFTPMTLKFRSEADGKAKPPCSRWLSFSTARGFLPPHPPYL